MSEREVTERRDPLLGATLGNYVVKKWIGQGGMGVVYRAEQPEIGKVVAIKVLRTDAEADPDGIKRMETEARALSAVRHGNIVSTYGFGRIPDGRPYLVMEYLEGESLDDYLERRKQLFPAEALSILDEVLAAVSAAHSVGVVHRDLKPGNIFLAHGSEGGRRVKVLDFGLAKRASQPFGSATQTAFRPAGTPEYMAPEQARGERVGPLTDLYSLGIVAFELVTGRIPFDAPTVVEILMKHINERPPSALSWAPGIPAQLDALIAELLQKDPHKRPPSAQSVRRRVEGMISDLERARTIHVAGPMDLPGPMDPVLPPPRADLVTPFTVPKAIDAALERREAVTQKRVPAITTHPDLSGMLPRPWPLWIAGVVLGTGVAAGAFVAWRSSGTVPWRVRELAPPAVVDRPAVSKALPAPPPPVASEPEPPRKAELPASSAPLAVRPPPKPHRVPRADAPTPAPALPAPPSAVSLQLKASSIAFRYQEQVKAGREPDPTILSGVSRIRQGLLDGLTPQQLQVAASQLDAYDQQLSRSR